MQLKPSNYVCVLAQNIVEETILKQVEDTLLSTYSEKPFTASDVLSILNTVEAEEVLSQLDIADTRIEHAIHEINRIINIMKMAFCTMPEDVLIEGI